MAAACENEPSIVKKPAAGENFVKLACHTQVTILPQIGLNCLKFCPKSGHPKLFNNCLQFCPKSARIV